MPYDRRRDRVLRHNRLDIVPEDHRPSMRPARAGQSIDAMAVVFMLTTLA